MSSRHNTAANTWIERVEPSGNNDHSRPITRYQRGQTIATELQFTPLVSALISIGRGRHLAPKPMHSMRQGSSTVFMSHAVAFYDPMNLREAFGKH